MATVNRVKSNGNMSPERENGIVSETPDVVIISRIAGKQEQRTTTGGKIVPNAFDVAMNVARCSKCNRVVFWPSAGSLGNNDLTGAWMHKNAVKHCGHCSPNATGFRVRSTIDEKFVGLAVDDVIAFTPDANVASVDAVKMALSGLMAALQDGSLSPAAYADAVLQLSNGSQAVNA